MVENRKDRKRARKDQLSENNLSIADIKRSKESSRLIGQGNATDKIKADRTIFKKSAFYIGNCEESITELDMQHFLTNLGISVAKINKIEQKKYNL